MSRADNRTAKVSILAWSTTWLLLYLLLLLSISWEALQKRSLKPQQQQDAAKLESECVRYGEQKIGLSAASEGLKILRVVVHPRTAAGDWLEPVQTGWRCEWGDDAAAWCDPLGGCREIPPGRVERW